jgi:hypothetical protein
MPMTTAIVMTSISSQVLFDPSRLLAGTVASAGPAWRWRSFSDFLRASRMNDMVR